MFRALGTLFGRRKAQWDWVQVEVTTRCDAGCVYCPRTVFRDAWHDADMSMPLFRSVLKACAGARHLHLQGWGEPLLHPRYPEMLAAAAEAGFATGLTTSGTRLDAGMARMLVECGVGTVALSLAGVGARNDEIRRGASTQGVLDAIMALREAKARAGSVLPRVNLSYMLLRSDVDGPERLPELLRGTGVESVIVSTLDHVAEKGLAAEAFSDASGAELAALQQRLRQVALAAQDVGIDMVWRLPLPAGHEAATAVPDPEEWLKPGGAPPELWSMPEAMLVMMAAREGSASCSENVGRSAVITVNGMVAPCAFSSLPPGIGRTHDPAAGAVSHRMLFGSIEDSTLSDVWSRPAYTGFRTAHAQGYPPPACAGCVKLRVR